MPLAGFLPATKFRKGLLSFLYNRGTEFLNVIGTKVLRILLLAIHSHLYYGFKSGLKLICNVNIVYGNLKSENSRNLNEIVRSRTRLLVKFQHAWVEFCVYSLSGLLYIYLTVRREGAESS